MDWLHRTGVSVRGGDGVLEPVRAGDEAEPGTVEWWRSYGKPPSCRVAIGLLTSQIFLFGVAYSFVYTPLTATYSAEVQANHTRAKGMGVVSPPPRDNDGS